MLSISELSDREQIKVLVNALTSEIKASGLSSDQIMILFETFTSIDTVHKMMSELDNLDIEERYKHCIMSCTYNARSLSDGTTPREVAAYCNRYDFIKYVGQNCCDITTDIDFVLSEYTKVTNKYLFCKPNTDAINVDTLLKYIDKYNLAIAGFCCGSSKELIEEVKELLPTNKEIIKNNIVESTYIRELLPSGSIVGDRINTTKNKKLIG
ncbi:hypothetical protein FACS189459_0440 [Bacilli bacterium]|nr:hypothetical protein FACS189459_0440 [Bacilli bacterium]